MRIYDDEKQELARKAKTRALMLEYVDNRINFYRNLKYDKLLVKDFAIFALRGVSTAEDYAREAFHAVESSSEETVMGSTWQRIIAAISDDTIDTGDLTATRDDTVYVIELKAQDNTTNSSSFPGELRGLRQRMNEIEGRRRASKQKVAAALCITRSTRKTSVDEWREFQASDVVRENSDLNGFKYRYLSGTAMWQFLCGIDSPYGLIRPFDQINTDEIREARESSLERVTRELIADLDKYHLGHDVEGVVELSDIFKSEAERKRRARLNKK